MGRPPGLLALPEPQGQGKGLRAVAGPEASRCVLALWPGQPGCGRVISRTLLLLQSLLLFFNWVESGNPGVPFLYKQEGFIIQGPSPLNGTSGAPTPLFISYLCH